MISAARLQKPRQFRKAAIAAMPEGSPIALSLCEEGIFKLNSFLTRVCNAISLSPDDVASYERSLVAGCEFHIQTNLMVRRLRVLVDERFPFSLPHFFLVDRPEFLTWPHIEEDGRLCLKADNKVLKPQYPEAVAGELLGQAAELISACEDGANQGDFRTEFYSYWNRASDASNCSIYSILRPQGPSRIVALWRGTVQTTAGDSNDEVCVLGESEAEVLSWLRHRYGERSQFDSTSAACFLWLSSALLPSQYPHRGSDVYRLACEALQGKTALQTFASKGKSPYHFVLGADCGNGICLAGLTMRTPLTLDIKGKRRNRTLNGFRPGKVPEKVQRVDSAWIHGRGYDPHQIILSKKRITIIGCGSIGAPIAQQLVMSGVGHVDLVDPGILEWANVGRHPLGAEHVGHNKAKALAEMLQRSYPHSTIQGFENSYEEMALRSFAAISSADLVLSLTAEWDAESLLNIQHVKGELKAPILYAWTEPHAAAGHAVLLPSASPCLQCGVTADGEAKFKVTDWPNGSEIKQEPACGALFQPYGPVELQGTISMAASLALDSLLDKLNGTTHRVWASPSTLLEDAGGKWSKVWVEGHPERESGGMQVQLGWPKDELCPACGESDTGAAYASKLAIQANASFSPRPFLIT
jgi:molybdopterin/thiamine biosynthesis adenylyltransferase